MAAPTTLLADLEPRPPRPAGDGNSIGIKGNAEPNKGHDHASTLVSPSGSPEVDGRSEM